MPLNSAVGPALAFRSVCMFQAGAFGIFKMNDEGYITDRACFRLKPVRDTVGKSDEVNAVIREMTDRTKEKTPPFIDTAEKKI